MTFRIYILDGRTPVAVPLEEASRWGKWLETANRRVAETTLCLDGKERWVSTVFLSTNHNFHGAGEPILFETMVQETVADAAEWLDYQERCSTWDEAEQQHARAVAEMMAEGWREKGG